MTPEDYGKKHTDGSRSGGQPPGEMLEALARRSQRGSCVAILAPTGEMRRKIERVEKLALELEQAVRDLNECEVSIEVKPLKQ